MSLRHRDQKHCYRKTHHPGDHVSLPCARLFPATRSLIVTDRNYRVNTFGFVGGLQCFED